MQKKINKTLGELYKDLPSAKSVLSPKQEFIRRLMNVTHRSEMAVRGWVAGRTPDELVQSVISKELGIPAEILFPKDDTTKTKQP